MKRIGKPVFFIVVLLIAVFTYLTFFGFSTTYGDITKTYIKGGDDIRWGIDVRGGVDVTFSPPEGVDATDEEMSAAESVIKLRMVAQNITDYEIYTDYDKDRIIVRFPWKVDEADFNPEQAVKELGETALLTFREGAEVDSEGKPSGTTAENVIITGSDVETAYAAINTQDGNKPVVVLKLKTDGENNGAEKFAEATGRLASSKGVISIWMDDTLISYPTVQTQITGGEATIEGNFTTEEATDLANKINAGALPFKLETENFSSINPTLGTGAKDAMVMGGAIAFILVAIFIIALYRLPGVIAVIGLAGQVAGTIAAITGFFSVFPSFTLTLPGVAGIILAIGIGVDANIITAERIREEINAGKTIDGAISSGFKRAFTAIFDGNVTVIIVAIILMGSFGPTSSAFAKLLKPIFFMFGPSTTGSIYSFGYTLLIGVALNFVFGVFASRLMLTSLSKFAPFRKNWLYGGDKK